MLVLFFWLARAACQVPMDAGFAMLEKGQFTEAVDFFSNVLKDVPDNKTARICLGRATGLGGNPGEALVIFNDLLVDHPGDIEVLYNMAEANLWNDNPEAAIRVYGEILTTKPRDGQALLGSANGYAALKDYETAVMTIDKAVAVDPSNPQAQLSRKFIYLARSDELRRQGEIASAHDHLDTVLVLFPGDEQALFDKATTYLFEQSPGEAQRIFKDLQPVTMQKVRVMSGLSYTSLLLADRADFLRYADSALYYQDQIEEVRLDLYMNKARALTLNNRSAEANALLDSLITLYPEEDGLKLCRVQLRLWQGRKASALQEYTRLYQTDTLSNDLKVGLAEAYNANGLRRSARDLAVLAASMQPDNPDTRRMARNMKLAIRPTIETALAFSSDKGGNEATEWTGSFGVHWLDNVHSKVTFSNRQVRNTNEGSRLSRQSMGFATSWQMVGALGWKASLVHDRLESAEREFDVRLSGQVGFLWNPGNSHSFEGSFSTSFMDYNPSLLSQTIRTSHYKLVYHAYTFHRIGTFNQLIYTRQSDQNQRFLYFGSLYYNLSVYPVIQCAVNYSYFGYDLARPEIYFSPDRFQTIEAMVKVDSAPLQGKRWQYLLVLASGYQFIEDNSAQWTLRAEAKLSYDIHDRIQAQASYLYSNAANSTAAGFTFNQVSGGVKIIF